MTGDLMVNESLWQVGVLGVDNRLFTFGQRRSLNVIILRANSRRVLGGGSGKLEDFTLICPAQMMENYND